MSPLERLYAAHAQAMFAFAIDLTRSETGTLDILQAEWQQQLLLSLAGEPGIYIENRYFPLPRNL